jgi:5-methylcytosine-specific restriction endonuclease McrA
MPKKKVTPSQMYSVDERVQVWEDGGRMCHYCDKSIPRPGTKGGKGTHLDHKIPHTKGGSHDLSNLYVSCKRCNTEKGNSDYEEFLSRRLRQAKKQVIRLSKLLLKHRHNG